MYDRESEITQIKSYSLIVAFTALTFLSTSLFYIAIVSTTGYFNLGESFVYMAALIGGPVVGGVAGGVGSALADIALGYGFYAPGTLIFKGAEGFTAGFLYYHSKKVADKIVITFKILALVIITGFTLFYAILFLFDTFGEPIIDYPTLGSITLEIPEIIGLFSLLVIVIILAWLVLIRMGDKAEMAISCLFSGTIIVVGYFLYQVYILGLPFETQLFEIPINIGQVIIGTIVAIPVVSYLRELGILPETASPTDYDCMICKSSINTNDNIVACPHCDHTAHQDHMFEWLKSKSFCPMCREGLNMDDLIEVNLKKK